MSEKSRRAPLPNQNFLNMKERDRWARLEEILERLRAGYSGLPAPHASTHLPDIGSDELTTGTPLSLSPIGSASSDGTATEFARSDHVHDTTDLLTLMWML
jgi:hypothetical protein